MLDRCTAFLFGSCLEPIQLHALRVYLPECLQGHHATTTKEILHSMGKSIRYKRPTGIALKAHTSASPCLRMRQEVTQSTTLPERRFSEPIHYISQYHEDVYILLFPISLAVAGTHIFCPLEPILQLWFIFS